MNESESLWNTEQLVANMELMQEQMESLQHSKEMLQRENQELQDMLENTKRKHSSEISKMQSVMRQLQKKLQEQTEQIVRQSKADLILKDNERLKQENEQIRKEKQSILEKAEGEVQLAKDKYAKEHDRFSKELDAFFRAERNLKQKEENLDTLIMESAVRMSENTRKECAAKYKRKMNKLQSEYRAKLEAHEGTFFGTCAYAYILTGIVAASSPEFYDDTIAFFKSIWSFIVWLAGMSQTAGHFVAGLTDRITQPIIAGILYWLIFVIVAVSIIAIPTFVIFLICKRYILWYKDHMLDSISLWVALITFIITLLLAGQIKGLIPVNLIVLNLLIHLIYSGIRKYIKGCRVNRGYY